MKILVNVHIPAISERFDMLIPDSLRIKTVVSLITNTIVTLTNHPYISSGEEILCSVEKGILLRNNATLERYGIKNGDHLIIM